MKRKINIKEMAVYIAAVALLLGCIGFLVSQSKEKQRNYEARLSEMAEAETEYIRSERNKQTETEPETEKQTEEPEQTETEPVTEAVKKLQNVLVLNATKKDGVAGYWKDILQKDGYEHVFTGSYTKAVQDETVLYAEKIADAAEFRTYFEGCRIRTGTLTEGVKVTEGEALPEEIQVCVVIGNNDAKSE